MFVQSVEQLYSLFRIDPYATVAINHQIKEDYEKRNTPVKILLSDGDELEQHLIFDKFNEKLWFARIDVVSIGEL